MDLPRGRVFVVHPITLDRKGRPSHVDLTAAAEYGEIVYINDGYIFGDQLNMGQIPDDPYSRFLVAVEQFRPALDFLLIAGDHLQVVAMSAFLACEYDHFRVLRYDRKLRRYLSVEIDAS